ncbi:hypothetical protein RRG08_022838 [Elysia crispata]|uniref:Uncharacterized protein n=1 Tax=Elysia crispata TaxID=231223 RepID=A0AAE0Z0F3_9GAST|nr:hypothetical protein RRG08_022838 [Elysia crispata]
MASHLVRHLRVLPIIGWGEIPLGFPDLVSPPHLHPPCSSTILWSSTSGQGTSRLTTRSTKPSRLTRGRVIGPKSQNTTSGRERTTEGLFC